MEFMRALLSALFALVTVVFLLAGSIPSALAQDGSDIQQDPRREWYELSKNRKEFEVSDAALLPTRLVLAAEQSGCDYKDGIRQLPARFMEFKRQRIAIIFCPAIIGSHRVFDLTDWKRARTMEFPIPLLYSSGFGTTAQPGLVTWKNEAGVFEVEAGSDLGCTGIVRYTYRLDEVRLPLNFVIIRTEIKKNECRQSEWTTIWEATTWSELFR